MLRSNRNETTSTKLAYETVNPKLSRPGQPRVNLIDTLTRR